MKKNKQANKIKIALIKNNAYKLRANYQIPYKLTYYIYQLDDKSNIELVTFLIARAESLLRVKGYYKKYPDEESVANKKIQEDIDKYSKVFGLRKEEK